MGLLAAVAFFLLGAAWAIALPVNGTYDENQHLVRAYAVADGQLLPHGRATDAAGLPAEAFRAPRSLLPENADCTWKPKPPKPASCQRPVADRTRTAMPSQAARYSPVYYALVGLPLRISPDTTGLVAARLLSALLAAGLLAAAAALAVRTGGRLLLAAVALVATPMVMNLAGAVNPNGFEIAAGVLLFVSLLALVRPDADASTDASTGRAPLVAAAVASVALLTTRHVVGPVLFAGVVAACALVAPRVRLVALARDRRVRLWLGLPALAGLGFAAWWLWYSRATDLTEPPGRGPGYGAWEILRRLPGERFRFYADQVVGRFGYGETTASPLLIAAWYALFGAVVLPALWFAGARLRLAVAGVAAASLAMLVVLELRFVPDFGWFAHSRYAAPLGVGVVLLAATSERYRGFLRARGWLGWPVTLLVAATVPLDLYAFLRVLSRFRSGIAAGLDPFGGTWTPPLGAAPALVTELAGAVALVVVIASAGPRRNPAVSDGVAVPDGPQRPGPAAWQTEVSVNDRQVTSAATTRRVGARKDELG